MGRRMSYARRKKSGSKKCAKEEEIVGERKKNKSDLEFVLPQATGWSMEGETELDSSAGRNGRGVLTRDGVWSYGIFCAGGGERGITSN